MDTRRVGAWSLAGLVAATGLTWGVLGCTAGGTSGGSGGTAPASVTECATLLRNLQNTSDPCAYSQQVLVILDRGCYSTLSSIPGFATVTGGALPDEGTLREQTEVVANSITCGGTGPAVAFQ